MEPWKSLDYLWGSRSYALLSVQPWPDIWFFLGFQITGLAVPNKKMTRTRVRLFLTEYLGPETVWHRISQPDLPPTKCSLPMCIKRTSLPSAWVQLSSVSISGYYSMYNPHLEVSHPFLNMRTIHLPLGIQSASSYTAWNYPALV